MCIFLRTCFGSSRERQKETEVNLSVVGPFPRVGQGDVRSQSLHPGYLCGWQEPKYLSMTCCLPGCVSVEAWNGKQNKNSNQETGSSKQHCAISYVLDFILLAGQWSQRALYVSYIPFLFETSYLKKEKKK